MSVERQPDGESGEARPRTHTGPLLHCRWDLDKTYIRTEFDTMRDLVRTWRATAEERVTVPGAAPLLRELLTADGTTERRVTFISGSPRQMRRVLVDKLRLDGIEPDDVILKPNLSNILRLRFKAVRGQLGYKLGALLESRVQGDAVHELLFGDDAEQDAFIYSLYADAISGRVDEEVVWRVCELLDVYGGDQEKIEGLLGGMRKDLDPVRRIFIHLDRRSPTARFSAFGGRVVPIFNYFQCAMVLLADGLLAPDSVLRVLAAMGADGYTAGRLANSLEDLFRRGALGVESLRMLRDALDASMGDGKAPEFLRRFAAELRRIGVAAHAVGAAQVAIDYVALAQEQGRYRRAPFALRGLGILD